MSDNFPYHTSPGQKLKSKNAAKLRRFGTENIRDLLREKCRIRVKEARQQEFSQNRPGNVESQQIDVKGILRQELAELDSDLELQEQIFDELIIDITDWLVNQLESEENYLVEVAQSQDLVCPVCQMSNLVVYQLNDGLFNYRCKCCTNFNFANNLEGLRQTLFHHVDEHERKCVTKLIFYVEPLAKKLEGLCGNCDYFCSL